MMELDTERNLLTVLLLGSMAGLVLLGLLFFVLLGRVNVDAIDPATLPPRANIEGARSEIALDELSEFAVITHRPLFFADRQLPVIDSGEEIVEAPVVEEHVEEPTPDLNAKVAGIVITPDMKLAMVNDRNTNETLVLREGMSMEGDKAAWRIDEIRDRGVRFVTDRGEEAELELEVETRALAGAPPPPRRANQPAAEANAQPNQPVANQEQQQDAEAAARARAEEVRRRVAERRAQLRAEAERRAREQQQGDG
ncbi:MAG: hypothetical protein AAF446_03910 [Pseudomonadota bacterium]